MKLYEQLADQISQQVNSGYFQPGTKLPSIRKMSQEHQVSISTVQEAYRLLEDRSVAEVRPKSGYYVVERGKQPIPPEISRPTVKPVTLSRWEMVVELLHSHELAGSLALGKGTPDVSSDTIKPLLKLMAYMSRRADINELTYDSLLGAEELRQQIARLMMDSGCGLHKDDIVITTGCQEALNCSIRALTQPGDIIAIESPSFYGSMQFIQAMGLKAIEIPTHPQTGISLEALELALEQWPIKTLLLTPTGNNPLGYIMPDAQKERLVELANHYDLPIIEDDIYGDLSYEQPRPRSVKSFDTEDRVLFCSSFSKTISPAFRTGWCAPGRYLEQIKHMKYVSTACGSILQPRVIAEFVAQGYYEKHIRKMRSQYLRNRDHMIKWAGEYFPEGTRMTYPQCSYLLWVEFPKSVDTQVLNEHLKKRNISIAPGILFTAAEKYKNCMRLNYSLNNHEEIQNAMRVIGEEVERLI